MENYIGYILSGLLVLSSGLLAVLIPGGPIENRRFSHIAPVILGAFNVFLTILGITSLILAYFLIRGSSNALMATPVCGVSYFIVYGLDLAKIFPKSPDKMPRALFIIEVVGLIFSIPLTFLALYYLSIVKGDIADVDFSLNTLHLAWILIPVLTISIVIFATKSAMKK